MMKMTRMLFDAALREFTKCVDYAFVENGEELIEYLNAQDSLPDLILLDLNMPRMDGREALKVIRSNPKVQAHSCGVYHDILQHIGSSFLR